MSHIVYDVDYSKAQQKRVNQLKSEARILQSRLQRTRSKARTEERNFRSQRRDMKVEALLDGDIEPNPGMEMGDAHVVEGPVRNPLEDIRIWFPRETFGRPGVEVYNLQPGTHTPRCCWGRDDPHFPTFLSEDNEEDYHTLQHELEIGWQFLPSLARSALLGDIVMTRVYADPRLLTCEGNVYIGGRVTAKYTMRSYSYVPLPVVQGFTPAEAEAEFTDERELDQDPEELGLPSLEEAPVIGLYEATLQRVYPICEPRYRMIAPSLLRVNIIAILLMMAGIEPNPGPFGTKSLQLLLGQLNEALGIVLVVNAAELEHLCPKTGKPVGCFLDFWTVLEADMQPADQYAALVTLVDAPEWQTALPPEARRESKSLHKDDAVVQDTRMFTDKNSLPPGVPRKLEIKRPKQPLKSSPAPAKPIIQGDPMSSPVPKAPAVPLPERSASEPTRQERHRLKEIESAPKVPVAKPSLPVDRLLADRFRGLSPHSDEPEFPEDDVLPPRPGGPAPVPPYEAGHEPEEVPQAIGDRVDVDDGLRATPMNRVSGFWSWETSVVGTHVPRRWPRRAAVEDGVRVWEPEPDPRPLDFRVAPVSKCLPVTQEVEYTRISWNWRLSRYVLYAVVAYLALGLASDLMVVVMQALDHVDVQLSSLPQDPRDYQYKVVGGTWLLWLAYNVLYWIGWVISLVLVAITSTLTAAMMIIVHTLGFTIDFFDVINTPSVGTVMASPVYWAIIGYRLEQVHTPEEVARMYYYQYLWKLLMPRVYYVCGWIWPLTVVMALACFRFTRRVFCVCPAWMKVLAANLHSKDLPTRMLMGNQHLARAITVRLDENMYSRYMQDTLEYFYLSHECPLPLNGISAVLPAPPGCG